MYVDIKKIFTDGVDISKDIIFTFDSLLYPV
jgi:hypothetical protein